MIDGRSRLTVWFACLLLVRFAMDYREVFDCLFATLVAKKKRGFLTISKETA